MDMRRSRLRLSIALTVLLSSLACMNEARTGPVRTESQSVKLGDAKSVRVELQMGAGDLKVAGDAGDLFEARFTYNVPSWKPKVDYRVTGDHGHLRVDEPTGVHSNLTGTRYNWDLRLNNKVPMELSVEMGAGRAEMTLGALSLNNFDLSMGAGEAVLDLTGNWRHNLTARVKGGVGQATIRLPRNVGVRVTATGGLGSISSAGLKEQGGAMVNDAYGKSPVTLNVDVQGGIGHIILELAGSPEPV